MLQWVGAVTLGNIRSWVRIFHLCICSWGLAAIIGVSDEEIWELVKRDVRGLVIVGSWASTAATRDEGSRLRSVANIPRGRNGHGSAGHEKLLLTIEPSPGKYVVTSRHVARDLEIEGLFLRVLVRALAMRAVPFVASHNFPSFTLVSTEASLTRSSPMRSGSSKAEVLGRTGFPADDGAALIGAEEVEVSSAGINCLSSAAIVGVVEIGVDRASAMRIVLCSECRWIMEHHMRRSRGSKEANQGSSIHDGLHVVFKRSVKER